MFLANDLLVSDDFATRLNKILSSDQIRYNEPMSRQTTFRIGGPADVLVEPATCRQVSAVVKLARAFGLPVTVMGNGSNLLVRDKGIRGLVLKMGPRMASVRRNKAVIVAGAGALLSHVANFAAAAGLSGMEFAVGIPGSVGGAVFMNAGAYDGEMKDVVTAVNAVSPTGEIGRFEGEALCFSYRHSVFQDNGYYICQVELTLHNGDHHDIRGKIHDYTLRRRSKQPLEMPSAGSTFKRPPGYYAGTLIEQAGLKGLRHGGAQVSEKHAGFIVNAGGATAADVLALIEEVQRRVYENFGVKLQPEVKIVGEE